MKIVNYLPNKINLTFRQPNQNHYESRLHALQLFIENINICASLVSINIQVWTHQVN